MSVLTEGSLEVKLPTYGQKKQQLWEQSEKRESVEWRSEKRKSQRRRERVREERARGKKIKGREKVEKSRSTVFFRCFVALEGRKVPLKRRVRSHLQGWKINNWARNGAKRIWKSTCKKRLSLGALLEVEMFKKCTRLGAKHMSKAKC